MDDEQIRTVGDLIDVLSTHSRSKPIVFQIPGARAVGVVEVESYEDAIVLRSEDSL